MPRRPRALAAANWRHFWAGDTLLLQGPIGAGKTHLARALIQARQSAAGRAAEDVPSPSFTLVQTYEAGETEIWHADLFRLGNAAEADELGLTDAFDAAICLIEWPERLGSHRTARRTAALHGLCGRCPRGHDSRQCYALGTGNRALRRRHLRPPNARGPPMRRTGALAFCAASPASIFHRPSLRGFWREWRTSRPKRWRGCWSFYPPRGCCAGCDRYSTSAARAFLPRLRLVQELAHDPVAGLPAAASPLRRRLELTEVVTRWRPECPISRRAGVYPLAEFARRVAWPRCRWKALPPTRWNARRFRPRSALAAKPGLSARGDAIFRARQPRQTPRRGCERWSRQWPRAGPRQPPTTR